MNATPRGSELNSAPATYVIECEWAKRELSYGDLLALHHLILGWALNGDRVTPERRTWLIQVACDYEAIANWLGPLWMASEPSPELPAARFLALCQRSRRLRSQP
jgi:hypothetical protein